MNKFCVAVAVVAVLWAGSASAGRLEMGNAHVDGELVTIPINLTGDVGEGVAAMDFQMRYDPQVLEPVEAGVGPAASQAGKTVSQNSSQPGSYTLVIMGLNQGVMQQGEVATVVMRRVGDASGGSSNVRIVDTTFASLAAEEIPSRGDSQNLRLDGSAPEEQPEEDTQEDEQDMEDDPQQASNSDSDSTTERATQASTGTTATPGTTSGAGAQQLASGAQGGNASGGAMPTGSSAAGGGGTTDGNATGGGTKTTAPNRSELGERMTTAVSQATGARTSLPAPQASPSGETAATGTAPATSTGATPAPGSPDYSNVQEIQLAQADDNSDATQSGAMASSDGGQSSAPAESTPSGANANGESATDTPAAAASGRDMKVVAVVGGAVAIGIVALLLVRKKLFA